jgi:hypothetical protein
MERRNDEEELSLCHCAAEGELSECDPHGCEDCSALGRDCVPVQLRVSSPSVIPTAVQAARRDGRPHCGVWTADSLAVRV